MPRVRLRLHNVNVNYMCVAELRQGRLRVYFSAWYLFRDSSGVRR